MAIVKESSLGKKREGRKKHFDISRIISKKGGCRSDGIKGGKTGLVYQGLCLP